jgi:hypothetical protein
MMNWQVAIGGSVLDSSPENKLSFFCGPKAGAGRWFFDIYIQGSKYNFKS